MVEDWNTGILEEKPRTVQRIGPAILCGLLFLSGCTTYDAQVREVRTHYLAGNYELAQQLTAEEVESSGGSGADALIWQLENAAVLRTAGKITESSQAFERARTLYTKYLDEAKIKIVKGGAAMLTTPANLPYYGTGYDGIMIDTYQTLNALQLGKLDEARVNITRSYLLQQEIVQANADRIEKEQEELAKDANTRRSLQRNKGLTAVTEPSGLESEMKTYSDYVNPFAVYLDGLYHLTQAMDSSDVERARKSLERASAFAPKNATVSHDLAIATQAVSRPNLPPSVYLIFETGMAPSLDQVRIDIPIIITAVSYVGVAFPKLHFHPECIPYLLLQATGNQQQRTERVVSMDAVITREFKNNLPSILGKAIAAAVTKTIAATALNLAAEQAHNDWVTLATRLSTAAYQFATNVADTRSWQTLPKEIQVARIDMPRERTVQLSTPDNTWRQEVAIIPGDVVVVYAKSPRSPATLSIQQFKLK